MMGRFLTPPLTGGDPPCKQEKQHVMPRSAGRIWARTAIAPFTVPD